MGNKDCILQTRSLCKKFAHTFAVNHVDMNIQRGDIYGFMGENGAGKTTFMRMIAGLAAPTSGSIQLFGSGDLQKGRRKIGCTIETPTLYRNMTAKENMEIFRKAFGISDVTSTDHILKLMDLESTGKKHVGSFSLGMRQRLAIAVALLDNPSFLILDEPINGLDPVGIQELRALLIRLNQEEGITLLISSHILGELSKVATRYGIIHSGILVTELSTEELQEKCERRLVIRTDSAERSAALLQGQLGITQISISSPHIVILREYVDQSEIVNEILFRNGITIFESTIQEENLENYYNRVIMGGGNS